LSKTNLNLELDGELYCHGMTFEEIVSITSRTVNLHSNYKRIQFHIFDIVEPELQMKRLIDLNNLQVEDPLIISPYWIAESLESIMSTFTELINFGYEGIIVRNLMNVYERKRSTMIMKFKPKQEDIYEILGVQEEISIDGYPKERLGALILSSGDGNTFNVGTGFRDEDREKLWNKSLIGKKARVQYQHITPGIKVPRFPVFVEII
jgi:ATP-dependent DNA ligase